MPESTLSEAAVAVLRFHVKGYRIGVNDRTLNGHRELVAAGIMEPVPDADGNPESAFRFTADGWARCEEWLAAAEAHLRSLQPRLPDRIELSESARDLLRRLTKGRVDVTPENKDAYRELARAGIMYPLSGFASGPESHYRFTGEGWERREEWLSGPGAPR